MSRFDIGAATVNGSNAPTWFAQACRSSIETGRISITVASLLLTAVSLTLAAWGCCALWIQRAHAPWRAPRLCIFVWLTIVCWFIVGLYLPVATALAASCLIAATIALLFWWQGIRPSNQRDWIPEVAMQTQGIVQGNNVTLHNVRNFLWRGPEEFDVRWETRHYRLDALESVDLALSYWTHPAIAHAIVSFGFGQGEFLAFSVEIRRKKTDHFSEIGGFFRMYELSVIAADERDILYVRSNIRQEDGYLYRVNMPHAAMMSLFLSYIDEANRLVDKPRFYNTITANCTTLVFRMMDRIVPGLPLDYRLLASGYLPEYLYKVQALEGARTIEQYRRLGRYTDRARANPDLSQYSQVVRQGVPGIGKPGKAPSA